MSNSNNQFGKVAVLLGGNSGERVVSLNSGNAVLQALLAKGVDAHAFDPAERNVTELTGFDRAFIVLHGRGGEDGQIQGLLQWLNVPYTGSGILASSLGMDKVRTKQIWLGAELPTMPYHLFDSSVDVASIDAAAIVSKIGLPMIIKPVHEGSSIGMQKVTTLEQLIPAVQSAKQHDSAVMAESWITGKEFTIVILDGKPLPVIRLQPPADAAFYDFDAKYNRNDTTYGIPCGLSSEAEQQLQGLALKAFNTIGAKGWGRIDAMQDEQGRFWLLEINTVPGMTDHSLVPMAAKAVGIDFERLCLQILQQTL